MAGQDPCVARMTTDILGALDSRRILRAGDVGVHWRIEVEITGTDEHGELTRRLATLNDAGITRSVDPTTAA